jgi:23S rRNA pseudouridine955/2504/2580 synthase
MREIHITEHEDGLRLDRYLRKLLRTVPLAAIFRMLRQGSIQIDGKNAAGDLRLAPGMRLQLRLPTADLAAMTAPPATPPPAASFLDRKPQPDWVPRIVQQDEMVLVLDKPAGLAVHAGTGQGHTVASWLQAQRFGVRTSTFAPAAAHRLDRGTSGLLLVGLTPESLRSLTAAFRTGEVHKVYHAVVHGIPGPRGTIAASLRMNPADDPRSPKMIVASDGDPARTDYEVVRQSRHQALLRVVPREGRQHQIRAHLAHLGHAIVGDQRYGSPADMGKGFLLHASEIEFPHPRSGKRTRCALAIPPAFLQLFEAE